MDKRLIPEIKRIIVAYNRQFYTVREPGYIGLVLNPKKEEITLESFEKKVNWHWVPRNYCLSYEFIYEYHDKLDMKYIFDNYMMLKKDFDRMIKEEDYDKFDILEL